MDHAAEAVVAAAPRVKPKLRGVSHQIAFFIALAGAAAVVVLAPTTSSLWSGLVYAASLAAMFGTSAAYHRPMWSLPARRRMRRLDHATIFLLIAGTYTPVCVLGLPGHGLLLAVVWAGAALGVLHAAFFAHAFRSLNVVLYVVLGCAVLPFVPAMLVSLGPTRTALLMAGGVVYIAGAVVYARRWPNPAPAVFGYHEFFHLMVVVAGALHFAAVIDLVRAAA